MIPTASPGADGEQHDDGVQPNGRADDERLQDASLQLLDAEHDRKNEKRREEAF